MGTPHRDTPASRRGRGRPRRPRAHGSDHPPVHHEHHAPGHRRRSTVRRRPRRVGVPRNRAGSRRIDLVQRWPHVADARLHRDGWPHLPAVRHAQASIGRGRARARRALPAAHGRRRVERARVAAMADTVRLVGGAAPVRRQPRASTVAAGRPRGRRRRDRDRAVASARPRRRDRARARHRGDASRPAAARRSRSSGVKAPAG